MTQYDVLLDSMEDSVEVWRTVFSGSTALSIMSRSEYLKMLEETLIWAFPWYVSLYVKGYR
jgi:hypothetical protein